MDATYVFALVSSTMALGKENNNKKQFVRIHALGSQNHPLDFASVREIYSSKSIVRSENTP